MATPSNTPKPVQSFKCGTVQAVIWKNTGKKGEFYSVTLGRSYKDAEEKWHTSDSFGVNDLSAVNTVLEHAEAWLRDHSK